MERPVRVDDPRVLVGRIRNEGGETALFLNTSPDTLSTQPVLSGIELDPEQGELTLEPFGAVSIRYAGSPPARVSVTAASEGSDARA